MTLELNLRSAVDRKIPWPGLRRGPSLSGECFTQVSAPAQEAPDCGEMLDVANMPPVPGNPPKFSASWDLLGSLEFSAASARVGRISNEPDLAIGLTAMQMAQIGANHGDCFIEMKDRSVRVRVYNVFGREAAELPFDSIFVSRRLAKRLGLSVEDEVALVRSMNPQDHPKA